jgi:hypothetical protein
MQVKAFVDYNMVDKAYTALNIPRPGAPAASSFSAGHLIRLPVKLTCV